MGHSLGTSNECLYIAVVPIQRLCARASEKWAIAWDEIAPTGVLVWAIWQLPTTSTPYRCRYAGLLLSHGLLIVGIQ